MLLLAPYAPHLAEELWQRLGHSSSLTYEAWPAADESLLVVDTVKLPVQVGGWLGVLMCIICCAACPCHWRQCARDQKGSGVLSTGHWRHCMCHTAGAVTTHVCLFAA